MLIRKIYKGWIYLKTWFNPHIDAVNQLEHNPSQVDHSESNDLEY